MKQTLKIDSNNSVSSLRAMMDIVEGKAMDAAKKFSGLALGGELGAAAALGRNNDPALSQPNNATPQDPATRGSGYATDANPGYNYKPYKQPTTPAQTKQSADNLVNAPQPYSAPKPEMHQFNISDTSYEQDHPEVNPTPDGNDYGNEPSNNTGVNLNPQRPNGDAILNPNSNNQATAIPKGPSDVPNAPTTVKSHVNKPHPAGLPKTPKAKFDPAVQKLQYELQAKGYPIKADGILGPQTQKILDWESMSASRNNAIQDFGALQSTMDEPITTPDEPIDNTQGDFDRMPELNESTELQRILQITQWR
jgi:hypothetical protein